MNKIHQNNITPLQLWWNPLYISRVTHIRDLCERNTQFTVHPNRNVFRSQQSAFLQTDFSENNFTVSPAVL